MSLGSPRGPGSLKLLELKLCALDPTGDVNLGCQPPEGLLVDADLEGEASSTAQWQLGAGSPLGGVWGAILVHPCEEDAGSYMGRRPHWNALPPTRVHPHYTALPLECTPN